MRNQGQTIIKGMGELHLDIIIDRMRREFDVEANVGAPQVAYRETIHQRTLKSIIPIRSRRVVLVSLRAFNDFDRAGRTRVWL